MELSWTVHWACQIQNNEAYTCTGYVVWQLLDIMCIQFTAFLCILAYDSLLILQFTFLLVAITSQPDSWQSGVHLHPYQLYINFTQYASHWDTVLLQVWMSRAGGSCSFISSKQTHAAPVPLSVNIIPVNHCPNYYHNNLLLETLE